MKKTVFDTGHQPSHPLEDDDAILYMDSDEAEYYPNHRVAAIKKAAGSTNAAGGGFTGDNTTQQGTTASTGLSRKPGAPRKRCDTWHGKSPDTPTVEPSIAEGLNTKRKFARYVSCEC